MTTATPGIQQLRSIAPWADSVREAVWLPALGQPATLEHIVRLYSLCMAWDVDYPSDLETHDEPKARKAWRQWRADRDGVALVEFEPLVEKLRVLLTTTVFSNIDDFRHDVNLLSIKAAQIRDGGHDLTEDFADALDNFVDACDAAYSDAEDLPDEYRVDYCAEDGLDEEAYITARLEDKLYDLEALLDDMPVDG